MRPECDQYAAPAAIATAAPAPAAHQRTPTWETAANEYTLELRLDHASRAFMARVVGRGVVAIDMDSHDQGDAS